MAIHDLFAPNLNFPGEKRDVSASSSETRQDDWNRTDWQDTTVQSIHPIKVQHHAPHHKRSSARARSSETRQREMTEEKRQRKKLSSTKRGESRLVYQSPYKQSTCAALCAVAGYFSLRGGISIYHHVRRSLLRQMLIDLYHALEKSSAMEAVWLDFGCLLGVYRDGDLILHDNDVDIAVLNPDWRSLMEDLRKLLPQYRIRLETPSDCPTTRFIRVYFRGFWGGFADIFAATVMDDTRLLVDCGHGETTAIETSSCLPTRKYHWRGIDLHVPRSIECVLEQRYGSDWRTPRYMDKGTDVEESSKTYAKIFRALSKFGIRL